MTGDIHSLSASSLLSLSSSSIFVHYKRKNTASCYQMRLMTLSPHPFPSFQQLFKSSYCPFPPVIRRSFPATPAGCSQLQNLWVSSGLGTDLSDLTFELRLDQCCISVCRSEGVCVSTDMHKYVLLTLQNIFMHAFFRSFRNWSHTHIFIFILKILQYVEY